MDLDLLFETYFAEGHRGLLSVADQIDTRTAAERMTLFILMNVAQWKREAIGERRSEPLAHLRREGVTLGRAAFAYRHAPAADLVTGRREIVAVAEEITAIERIRVLRAESRTFASIAQWLSDEGHRTPRGGRWLPNTVRRV